MLLVADIGLEPRETLRGQLAARIQDPARMIHDPSSRGHSVSTAAEP